MSKYVKELIQTQRKAIEAARTVQTTKDAEHMKSAKDAISEFAVGALVTLGYPQNQDGVS